MTINDNLNPVTIMVDFEQAMINSVHQVLPNTQVKGCFYHLSQNVYRKIQEHGLQQWYQEESEDDSSPCFCPTTIAAFEELCDELPAESQPVVDYFEDTYVGRPQHRGRRPPIFGNDLWNMFDRAQDELPRTNNSVEG